MIHIKHTWMTLLLVSMATTMVAQASTITLKKVLRSAKSHNTLSKSLEQEALALQAKSMAQTASDPYEIFGEGVNARPQLGNNGYEYAIGVSKNIMLGDIQEQERNIARLGNEATILDEQKRIIGFVNALNNLYHQYCLDTQNLRSFKQNYNDLHKLYKKKQKAYKYQEISKAELMQIESEKNRLSAQLKEMKMMQNILKEKLLMLSRVSYNKNTKLSCRDTYPIRSNIRVGKLFKLSKKAQNKRLQSTRETIKRYDNTLESVNVSTQYASELDTDRVSIGVSVPLTFTSKRSEYERVAAMYKHSALAYGYEQSMNEKKSLLRQYKAELKSKATMVKMLTKNYNRYKNNVLPLIRKSYTLGETSVIEYLLNRQKLYALNQEIHASKKVYYETLFRLYTLIEKD